MQGPTLAPNDIYIYRYIQQYNGKTDLVLKHPPRLPKVDIFRTLFNRLGTNRGGGRGREERTTEGEKNTRRERREGGREGDRPREARKGRGRDGGGMQKKQKKLHGC